VSLFSGSNLDEYLSRPGAPDPNRESHFAPKQSQASFAWLGLLMLPGLVFRRRAGACHN
jgi:hypothetical protein